MSNIFAIRTGSSEYLWSNAVCLYNKKVLFSSFFSKPCYHISVSSLNCIFTIFFFIPLSVSAQLLSSEKKKILKCGYLSYMKWKICHVNQRPTLDNWERYLDKIFCMLREIQIKTAFANIYISVQIDYFFTTFYNDSTFFTGFLNF